MTILNSRHYFFGAAVEAPALFEHFLEHPALNSNIGLITFLSMHYWGDDMDDDDNERNMQLPCTGYFVSPTQVFEKDMDQLSIGQTVTAYTNHAPDKKYTAEVLLIGGARIDQSGQAADRRRGDHHRIRGSL